MLEGADKIEIRNYILYCLIENGYENVTEEDMLKSLQEVVDYTKDIISEF